MQTDFLVINKLHYIYIYIYMCVSSQIAFAIFLVHSVLESARV